ncbi:MAG: type I glyceraldehyde-3-phosphate dehydrogenase [Ammonifex sp.]|nr:MAG: type I glyceraldehyde-3-phosphate dehydrogenase [Ammonifex sp.]
MTLRVGINGFGRIGRLFLRAGLSRETINVVAVNHKSRRLSGAAGDLARYLAHSLQYDSVHGTLPADVHGGNGLLKINGREVRVFSEANPAAIPWQDLQVDIVVESTGRFRDGQEAAKHLSAGVKKVIITAPAKNEDITIVMGVNHHLYEPAKHHIISNASCTTNCLAPVAKILHTRFGIVKGLMNTIHAYTNDQQILDMPHKDFRRGRSANLSIIPTTTGAAKAIGRVLPELEGKLNGLAFRVPVPNVSVVDLVLELARPASAAEVNEVLKEASEADFKSILAYTEIPLVSRDFNGNPHSAVVDGLSTMVIGNNLVRVVAWYDNEWAYVSRAADLAEYIAAKGLK